MASNSSRRSLAQEPRQAALLYDHTLYDSKLHSLLHHSSRHKANGNSEKAERYWERTRDRALMDRPVKLKAGKIFSDDEIDDELIRERTAGAPREVEFLEDGLRLPLHLALQNPDAAPIDVVKALLEAFPDSVRVPLVDALPLHLACSPHYDKSGRYEFRNMTENAERVVKLLATVYPDAVWMEDGTALHLLLEHKPSVQLVRFVLDLAASVRRVTSHIDGNVTPELEGDGGGDGVDTNALVATRDCEGQLPLHVAVDYHAHDDVIRLLLEEYPEGAKTRHGKGYLPLHVAALWGCTPDVLGMLLKEYPKGVWARTSGEKDTPLHLIFSLVAEHAKRWGRGGSDRIRNPNNGGHRDVDGKDETSSNRPRPPNKVSSEFMVRAMIYHYYEWSGRSFRALSDLLVQRKNKDGHNVLTLARDCASRYDVPRSLVEYLVGLALGEPVQPPRGFGARKKDVEEKVTRASQSTNIHPRPTSAVEQDGVRRGMPRSRRN